MIKYICLIIVATLISCEDDKKKEDVNTTCKITATIKKADKRLLQGDSPTRRLDEGDAPKKDDGKGEETPAKAESKPDNKDNDFDVVIDCNNTKSVNKKLEFVCTKTSKLNLYKFI